MKIRLILLFTFLSIVIGGIAGSYFAISSGIPSIDELKHTDHSTGTKIFADNDVLIGELKTEKGIYVPIDTIPQNMVNAIVAVEDSRFWKHQGLDYIAIGRALVTDILHARLKEGGSTLTQQLAKVVFLSSQKTLKRKIMEAALAVKIEKNLTKKEILELYLNRVYFGHGAYGIEMASKTYFNKSVKQLTLAEAALMAGLVKAPSSYSPFNDISKAKERQMIVLGRMVEEGYINDHDKESAYNQPLYLSSQRKGTEVNSYFTDYVRKYLEDKYGQDKVYKEGLKVYTTLNPVMQASAVAAVQAGLRDVDKRQGWRGPIEHKEIDTAKEMGSKEIPAGFSANPGDIYSGLVVKVSDKEALIKTRGVLGKLSIKDAMWAAKAVPSKSEKPKMIQNFALTKILRPGDVIKVSIKAVQGKNIQLSLEQEPEVEGALIAVEPYSGFIRSMVGGYDFIKSDFNRVVMANRQPGSSFKPIIYAAAMDNGYTPASIINDEAVTYTGGPKGDWSPENYDHKFYGPTRLREALAYSRNVVTVKLVDAMGIDNLLNFAKLLGFHNDLPRNLSIALGSFSVTPFDMAMIYDVFASGGMRVKPIFIKYVTDDKGQVLESNEPGPEQIISMQTAFLITSMMQDVVKYGTAWRAKSLGLPVAGKTGTTNEYKDAWFVGYSSNLVACVWVGFDNYKTLGTQETGARAALPIWLSFMGSSMSGQAEEFTPPEGIVSANIDPQSGLLATDNSGIKEYFKEGTLPKQVAPSKSTWEAKDPSEINFD